MSQSATAKLHELRSKTNRELVSLISNKLERGLAFARLLDGGCDWAAAEHFAQSAEQALAEASAWMNLLQDAQQMDRRRLEAKMAQLRNALAEPRMRAAC